MDRFQKTFVLALVAAIPGAAPYYFAKRGAVCFTAGPVTYMITDTLASPDYRVRVDRDPDSSAVRMVLVDQAASADFVLADDAGGTSGSPCQAAGPFKTIRVVDDRVADLAVALSRDPSRAQFRLYVRSARLSQEEGAALFGVMQHVSNMDRRAGIR